MRVLRARLLASIHMGLKRQTGRAASLPPLRNTHTSPETEREAEQVMIPRENVVSGGRRGPSTLARHRGDATENIAVVLRALG